MSCNHSDLESVMERVETYQGGGQRHICAGCAYLLGQKHRADGAKFDPSKVDYLPESQAQPQRHRNAYDAYRIGFNGI